MSDAAFRPAGLRGALTPLVAAIRGLDRIPYWLLALPPRFAIAAVFWKSGATKIGCGATDFACVSGATFGGFAATPGWNSTVMLFAFEYQAPLLPPELAAYLATAAEILLPILLVLGLATRASAAALLAMTAVIQFFVLPNAWAVHLQWAALLLILLARGPGLLSLDALIRRRFMNDGAQGAHVSSTSL